MTREHSEIGDDGYKPSSHCKELPHNFGVEIVITQLDDGLAVVSSTFEGFTSTLTVSPQHEVRIIHDPHVLERNGINGSGQWLIIREPNDTLSIADLQKKPKGVSTNRFLTPRGQVTDGSIPPDIILNASAPA